VTAYLLASTATTPLWGKLGDQYGRKRFFLAAISIFLVGSALAGISASMNELIAFRALQGLGAGGLIVTAQALIGDVVSPRERGRYLGLFGAVFGISSVIGPLIGGLLVDSLSWHGVFYVNLPIGAVALVAAWTRLPDRTDQVAHRIDYLGTVLIAAASVALVLFTSWGGTTYPWGSAPEMITLVAAVVLLVAFALVERRAAEPVLPLHLFRNRVFSSTSAIGFVIGFAMFGAITFLPQFLQLVQGYSPTISGLRLLPMMAGLLIASIGSGQLITRFGRYKIFPVVGTAITAVGLFLLSRMAPDTSTVTASLSMFVLGVGLGLVMQVLVIAVQNAVGHRDLGVATSSATYFRQMGASFGVAVFGAILTHQLTSNLTRYFGNDVPAGLATSASPATVAQLPPAEHAAFVHAYAASLDTVFLVAVPVAVVAFTLTWLLPEVPLRTTAGPVDPTGVSAGVVEPDP
jgi:EmrB/QacA subfamily drug resistance transporter